MTHEDAGHYAAKHSKKSSLDSHLMEAISSKISDGKITCAALHGIAEKLKIPPEEVGMAADLLEAKIYKCQLGLFGHGKDKKIKTVEQKTSIELEKAIKALMADGYISCLECWNIAKKTGNSKLDVSVACEMLKVKISPCQLGAFMKKKK